MGFGVFFVKGVKMSENKIFVVSVFMCVVVVEVKVKENVVSVLMNIVEGVGVEVMKVEKMMLCGRKILKSASFEASSAKRAKKVVGFGFDCLYEKKYWEVGCY